jgi:hypothetical protein
MVTSVFNLSCKQICHMGIVPTEPHECCQISSSLLDRLCWRAERFIGMDSSGESCKVVECC